MRRDDRCILMRVAVSTAEMTTDSAGRAVESGSYLATCTAPPSTGQMYRTTAEGGAGDSRHHARATRQDAKTAGGEEPHCRPQSSPESLPCPHLPGPRAQASPRAACTRFGSRAPSTPIRLGTGFHCRPASRQPSAPAATIPEVRMVVTLCFQQARPHDLMSEASRCVHVRLQR